MTLSCIFYELIFPFLVPDWKLSTSPRLKSPRTSPKATRLSAYAQSSPAPRHRSSTRKSLYSVNSNPESDKETEIIGRFERDFVEVDELGVGEFGRVIKAALRKGGDVFAIKQSKRYEGVKHRFVSLHPLTS